MHPSLEPTVKDELNKLLVAHIIFPVWLRQWVANLVLVWKKNGDIRLCGEFQNLNRSSDKDGYLVPSIEQTLQQVFGSEIFYLLDGFSGYNQVLVAHEDKLKTNFRTKWGTYAYRKMRFRLIKASVMFQRAMDITFHGLLGKSMVVYLDDVIVFSKKRGEHIAHLKHILDQCRKYGISLNPNKSIFCVTEGKLLRFVVSKDGMMIDPKRVEVIEKLPPPHNKKSMQSFMGKINFVRILSHVFPTYLSLCKIR